MALPHLNYHHLQYFWRVAHSGNLTRTAEELRVSQSALSSQIRLLEGQLGQPLFSREGRRLVLTEAGHMALRFADGIFQSGEELVATFVKGRPQDQPLNVGAVATLSRNFQESFIKPLLGQPGVRLRLQSGSLDELLQRLRAHALDVVLSNRPVKTGPGEAWRCRRIARQKVSLVGRPGAHTFRYPRDLGRVPMVVPGPDSEIRSGFDALCTGLSIRPQLLAEVDDMALMRLLARDTHAMALVPSVVVRDELRSGVLQEYCVVPGLMEVFYAITVERQFEHPLVRTLLGRAEDELLAMEEPPPEGPTRARPPRRVRRG